MERCPQPVVHEHQEGALKEGREIYNKLLCISWCWRDGRVAAGGVMAMGRDNRDL